ncbi:hypothetical protein N7467_010638 [Penicillium canescens]|nr:hypothetical protein N7467_010638 [Penicillium canescens]
MSQTTHLQSPVLDDIEKVTDAGCIHLEYLDNSTAEPTKEDYTRVYRKIDHRILPLVALTYLLCYLDRTNIGNAKVLNSDTDDDLMSSIGMTDHHRVALMLFLVAYSLFEAPSNLAMKALFPPILIIGVVIYQHRIRWLGSLVICFGSLCAGIGGSKNVPTIIPLRFLLGAAEAGVYPGIIVFLSFWYGHENEPSESPSFFVAPLWQAPFGDAIAYGIGHMNQVGSLEAWRWLFIIEGLPL